LRRPLAHCARQGGPRRYQPRRSSGETAIKLCGETKIQPYLCIFSNVAISFLRLQVSPPRACSQGWVGERSPTPSSQSVLVHTRDTPVGGGWGGCHFRQIKIQSQIKIHQPLGVERPSHTTVDFCLSICCLALANNTPNTVVSRPNRLVDVR
jgi:hypothetical protein